MQARFEVTKKYAAAYEAASKTDKGLILDQVSRRPGLARWCRPVWVYLIRALMRYVSYSDRKAMSAMLKPIYTAVDDDALMALTAFADSVLGRKYPMAVKTWEDAWDRFIPFLDFGPATRKVIYTTNQIESLNYQMRKIIKNRAANSPTTPRWSSCSGSRWATSKTNEPVNEPRKQAYPKAPTGRPPGKLVEGATIQGWTKALNKLAPRYPERFPQTT